MKAIVEIVLLMIIKNEIEFGKPKFLHISFPEGWLVEYCANEATNCHATTLGRSQTEDLRRKRVNNDHA